MYYQNNSHGRLHNAQRAGRGTFGGQRFIKTFDPTRLIETPKPEKVQKEYVTLNSFETFKISENLRNNILRHGYKTPTPIQDQAIPLILQKRDLIGIASTGTGKTAAFLIPLIDLVLKDRNQKVLIITPTRELAIQIRDEFFVFAKDLRIYGALCIGGTGIGRQRADLQRNPNFVISTPGRLRDLVNSRSINLSGFTAIVLDEADRMVDIGFINEIKYLISLFPVNRLSLFFSATINDKVRGILGRFVKNAATITIRKSESSASIEQKIVRVEKDKKFETLAGLLKQEGFKKVLIFGRTKHGVQKLSDVLSKNGFRSGAIHGNKNQSQRTKVLENFKRNNLDILIATDVAARGLDIPNVSHVINYDLPEDQDSYTHRIGRTGRAGNKGYALSFVE